MPPVMPGYANAEIPHEKTVHLPSQGWLSDLAEAQQIDTVIVLGTLKAAPPAAGAHPPHIEAQWIERGAAGQMKEAA